jgi:hypothetical protein
MSLVERPVVMPQQEFDLRRNQAIFPPSVTRFSYYGSYSRLLVENNSAVAWILVGRLPVSRFGISGRLAIVRYRWSHCGVWSQRHFRMWRQWRSTELVNAPRFPSRDRNVSACHGNSRMKYYPLPRDLRRVFVAQSKLVANRHPLNSHVAQHFANSSPSNSAARS